VEVGYAYEILVANPEGKLLPWKTKHKCENNIKMYSKNIACDCVNWVSMNQGRIQG
jgi:hypothetical protein